MDTKQADFIQRLEQFTEEVKAMRQFKGKAQVIKVLRRIPTLSAFR